jgi:hypothetical protein
VKFNPNVVKFNPNVVKFDPNVVKFDPNVVKFDLNVVKFDLNVVKFDLNVMKFTANFITFSAEFIGFGAKSSFLGGECFSCLLNRPMSVLCPGDGGLRAVKARVLHAEAVSGTEKKSPRKDHHMGRNFFNGTDAELFNGSNSFSTKITATPTAFGLVAAQATAYAALNTAYSTAYLAAIDPATRTKAKVSAKNQAKANLKASASNLAKIIDGTPTVTNEQKLDLGLNVRAMPQPIPPPSVSPGVDIVSVVGRTVKVHIHDSASSTKRGKPPGVLGANVYSFVGATYPTAPTEWKFEGSTTKNTFDILFPSTVANGAQVWICAMWFNKTTQPGPVSAPITTNVQGGLSMVA